MIRHPVESIAYYNPLDKYVIRTHQGWSINAPMSPQGLRVYLVGQGWDSRDVKRAIDQGAFQFIAGTFMQMTDEDLLATPDGTFINLYQAPSLTPASDGSPQAWPRIHKILGTIIGLDEREIAWANNWFATKIQNPLRVMPTAQVWITEQGTGKSTMCHILKQILGDKHVQILKASSLDKFQAFWPTLLLGFFEEMNAENRIEFAEKLKSVVANKTVSAERKYQDARDYESHAGFVVASNNLSAVPVTEGDRRYTILGKKRVKPTEAHKEMMAQLWVGGREFAPDFLEEIRAWWRYLLDYPADENLASTALQTEARKQSQRIFVPQVKSFADDWALISFDKMLEKVKSKADDDVSSKSKIADNTRADGFLNADFVFQVFVAHVKTKRSSRSTNTGFESFMAEMSCDSRFTVERDADGQEWMKLT